MERKSLKVGLMSRLDYGGTHYRVGLWQLAANIFEQEKVNYVILLGGLVDSKALDAKLKLLLKGVKKDRREAERKNFLKQSAEFLKNNIPVIDGVKIYIITSPAYDGYIGEEVARLLTEMRQDILLYLQGGDRLQLKQLNKILGAYTPKKGVWLRGDYYDTPVLRVLKGEKQRGSRGLGDFNVVGCFGSAIHQTGDSNVVSRPYASVPALCKISESKTGADNQVGIMILDFSSDNPKEVSILVQSFKDLLSDEWLFIEPPDGISKAQKDIIDTLRKRGPLTVGSLQDFSGLDRQVIIDALSELSQKPESNGWSNIVQDKENKRFYFNPQWFCDRLRYKLPKEEQLESYAAFGCMHAASRYTDMRFVKESLPEFILKEESDTLIGVGDFIEGLKHDLLLMGEIVADSNYILNYTKQEKLAAFLVGSAIFKVFKGRFDALIKNNGKTKIGQKKLIDFVKKSLIKFIYIPGNHCKWVKPLGFDPLSTFRGELKVFLIHHIAKYLEKYDLYVYGLADIVQEKVIELKQNEPYKTDSALSLALLHPSMSRTKTTSIRPQEMLKKAEDSKSAIVFGANFHVSEAVHHWNFDYGQRICLQLGTLKVKSDWEEEKLKTVDFGVGFLKVWSKNGRILKDETTFYCTPSADIEKSNKRILKEFDKWMKINK